MKEGFGLYTYCRNNPLSFKDPTGLTSNGSGNAQASASDFLNILFSIMMHIRKDVYAQEYKNSWKDQENTKGLGAVWNYGFYGGDNYAGGIYGNEKITKDNYKEVFSRDALNNVDQQFKQHDLDSFNKETGKFYDHLSPEAIKADKKLIASLDEILKSGKVFDIKGNELKGLDRKDALDAAFEAKMFFSAALKVKEFLISKQDNNKKGCKRIN